MCRPDRYTGFTVLSYQAHNQHVVGHQQREIRSTEEGTSTNTRRNGSKLANHTSACTTQCATTQ
eukprot:4802306-Alexandrium_andersonii.AAC.1